MIAAITVLLLLLLLLIIIIIIIIMPIKIKSFDWTNAFWGYA